MDHLRPGDLIVAAVVNMIDGIAAISESSFYIADARYVFSDLNTWGWIVLGLGALQALVAVGMDASNQVARWAGIVIVSLNAIAQAPVHAAVSVLGGERLDGRRVLVLYGLAAHGRGPKLR